MNTSNEYNEYYNSATSSAWLSPNYIMPNKVAFSMHKTPKYFSLFSESVSFNIIATRNSLNSIVISTFQFNNCFRLIYC